MDQHQHNPEVLTDPCTSEAAAVAQLEAELLENFGPVPAKLRLDGPPAIAALGDRIQWLAERLELPTGHDSTQLAVNVVRRAELRACAAGEVVRIALLALTLDRLDQSNCECLRTIQREAHRDGVVLSPSDIRYHLRSMALAAWQERRQLAQLPDGVIARSVDGWILEAGRTVVAQKVSARTDTEDGILAELLPRFGAFLGSRWTNVDHELRQEMLQEGALRLLRTERSRNLEEEVDNPDGYRFQIFVNRARSEFDRHRRHRDRVEVIKDDSRGDLRLSHVDCLPDYTENPVDILRLAAAAGGPIEQLLALRPRNVHGPTLLAHLRDAVDADLTEETRLVVEMECCGAFGTDRTKDGSAALNRIVWAAATLRDPVEYPPGEVNTEHRPMKRVRRFVEDFVVPCVRLAGVSEAA